MKINVKHSSGSYPVVIINRQIIDSFTELKTKNNSSVFLIVDSKVDKIYGHHLMKGLSKIFKIIGKYIFIANEKNKSINELNKLLTSITRQNCTKETLLIAIGGGITGDLSAFAASIYLRGIQYIHIPTTLLSMIDSSIGGKTGINFQSGKNIIGTYFQPKVVLINPEFLRTLPVEEIQSGTGEIIKYSFLTGMNDRVFSTRKIERILNKDFSDIHKLIADCIKLKSTIVEKDEYEKGGLRGVLNFGHTFAHGIESSTDFKVMHGNAVLLGIITSLFYSYRVKLISGEFLFNTLTSLISYTRFLGKSVKLINPEKVFKNMQMDKKRSEDNINLVLLKNYGELILNYPANKSTVVSSVIDMKVWVWESFKKETVEK